jgi:hypothetical protein
MATTIRRAKAFRLTLGDRVGALTEVLAGARNAGIDLQSVVGYVCGGQGVILAVPRDLPKARPAASSAPWAIGERDVFLIEGDDERGALCGITEKLAAAKVSIETTHAVVVGRKFGAIVAVPADQVDRAAAALGV